MADTSMDLSPTFGLNMDMSPGEIMNASKEIAKDLAQSKEQHSLGLIAAVVFYLLLDAMETRQDTVLNQSKQLNANADAQNKWNRRDGDVMFEILPEGATQATINRVQDINQARASQKDTFRDRGVTARQVAQVLMTLLSTGTNYLEEDATEDSDFLKTLKESASAVLDMLQPQQ